MITAHIFQNSAHIDLSAESNAGKMGEFHGNSTKFLDMVNDDANKWLPTTFQLAKMKKRFPGFAGKLFLAVILVAERLV